MLFTEEENTKILPEIKKLLKDAYEQYAKENSNDPVPRTMDAAMNSFNQWKGIMRYWDICRARRLSPFWLTVFLSSFVIEVALPLVFQKIVAIAAAIVPPIFSGIFFKFNDAKGKLKSAQVEIATLASKMRLLRKSKFKRRWRQQMEHSFALIQTTRRNNKIRSVV